MSILAAFVVPHPPLIIPEVGHGDERGIASTVSAYEKIAQEVARLKPETIIVSSPHAEAYADYFQLSEGEVALGSFAQFRAPQVSFRTFYDKGFGQQDLGTRPPGPFPCRIGRQPEA
jgi:aromatic ring-opening dioxygenase LigB subunit